MLNLWVIERITERLPIDPGFGEEKAQSCENACFQQLTKTRHGTAHALIAFPAIATSRTPLWLPSGWECRGRRLSTA